MLKKVGVYLPATGAATSASFSRAYYWQASFPNPGLSGSVHRVEEGDRIKRIASAFYSSPASGVGSVQMALYHSANNGNLAGMIQSWVVESPIQSPQGQYYGRDIDFDLAPYIGTDITVANGLWSNARMHIVSTTGGNRFFPDAFPPNGGSGTSSTANSPLYYMEIESPAPEGFTDIVVGDDPLYGDDRSIVKDFTGTPPAPGDQLRYANLTAGGAEIVVRPDLTYTGDYGSNPVPQQDTVEVAYWSGTEWQWYTVTVVFSDTPPEEAPVNTVLPEITGVAAVRQELTTTNGTWTGSPTGFTYRWLVDGVDTGITTNTFTPVDDSYQKLVTVEVIATNDFGSTAAVAEAVGPLEGIAPQLTGASISGVPKVGRILSSHLTISGVPTANVLIEWFKNDGEPIGTNSRTYVPRPEDEGAMIFFGAMATNGIEPPATIVSDPVGPVQAADPVEDSDFIYLDWIALNYPKGDADA